MRWLATVAMAIAACGTGSGGSDTAHCLPGSTVACACPGGDTGSQTCATDGDSLSECACPIDLGTTNDAAVSCGSGLYPCGPYGVSVGSTIANLSFVGELAPGDAPALVSFGELAATAGVEVLAFDTCALWCEPCAADQPDFVALAATEGAHALFVDAVLQDVLEGPADVADLEDWQRQFHVPFPVLVDPDQQLQSIMPDGAFPTHVVVRASDLAITYIGTGGSDANLQPAIDAVLTSP